MKRNGCTASRLLFAAAGLAMVSSLAAAQSNGVNTASKAVAKPFTTVSTDQLLGESVGVAGGVVADFIGVDGTLCPPGATPEGEPCVIPIAVPDVFNGGCNTSSATPPLTTISVGQVICGHSARALNTDDNVIYRDTDWYTVTITTPGNYVLECLTTTGNPVAGFIGDANGPVLNPTCAQVAQINPYVTGVGGGRVVPTMLQAGTYWLFVSSTTTIEQPCFEYTLRIVPEDEFWGACCQPGMFCSFGSAADCVGFGGIFQGEGTDCGSTECPDVMAPENNDCFMAYVFTAGDLNGPAVAGTNIAASAEFGLPNCSGTIEGPAVWYLYDATALGGQSVTVSLCQTGTLPAGTRITDTIVNVFTNTIPDFCLGTFCCAGGNDDGATAGCDFYSEATFCADPSTNGGQYFILVSGYLGDTGDFLINITGDGTPCTPGLCVACQPGDAAEGESCPSFPDTFNGGCNSTPNVFSSLTLNQTVCGTSSTNGSTRDTDWYEIVIPEAGEYELVYEAGYEGVAGFIGATSGVPLVNPTCAAISVIAVLTTPEPCTEGVVTANLQAGIYWIFAGPLNFEGVSCPDDATCPGNGRYRLTVRPAGAVVPCDVDCPAGAVAECEACTDGGATADTCNDGCNNDVFAAQSLNCGDTVCGTVTAGNSTRDTDWYEIVVTDPAGAVITASLESAFNGVVFIVDAPSCDNLSLLGTIGYSACTDGVQSGVPAVASVGPGTYYVFVSSGNPDGSGIFSGVSCAVNADYVLTVTGDCGGASCSCSADLTGDCVVNADDLGVLLGNMGCTGSCAADLNGDGIVNADDLGILLGNLGCAG
jgi:hypothetical protein